MHPAKMTTLEKRAVISLSSIMGLRMLGLFMVLPVFTLYARDLKGATPTLIGLAMGIYGLAQALLQIPFGALSDRFGRKPIIFIGLMIFLLGSLLCAYASSIEIMIAGRALQGAGAVGSTLLAMLADLTREEQRTKSMAIAGITIGFSFSLAMMLGPLLTKWMPIHDLFLLAVLFSCLAMLILHFAVPKSLVLSWHGDAEPEWRAFAKLLKTPALANLNAGIFILHALFTASFIVIPVALLQFSHLPANRQWLIYLPALLAAFAASLVCIGMAERKRQIKPYFLAGILALIVSEGLFWLFSANTTVALFSLFLFFTGFSLLEAFLPSLVSRTAPAARKGTAMGIYSCSQFLGIFIGGALGGWLYGQFSFLGVYLFCLALAFLWLAIAGNMQPPDCLVTQMLRLLPSQLSTWETTAAKLRNIPGMVEVVLAAKENVAYLKMQKETIKHPDYIRLKEQLQSE